MIFHPNEYAVVTINANRVGTCGTDIGVGDCVPSTCLSFDGTDVTADARTGALVMSFSISSDVNPICGADADAMRATATLVVTLSDEATPTAAPSTTTPLPGPTIATVSTFVGLASSLRRKNITNVEGVIEFESQVDLAGTTQRIHGGAIFDGAATTRLFHLENMDLTLNDITLRNGRVFFFLGAVSLPGRVPSSFGGQWSRIASPLREVDSIWTA